MSIPGAWTHAIAATQAQIREARAEIAALNECIQILEEKLKAREPWALPAFIAEPAGYDVTFEIGEEAAKTFGWNAAISLVRAKIRETRTRINERRKQIKSYREKRTKGEEWPSFSSFPETPGMIIAVIGNEVHLIPLPYIDVQRKRDSVVPNRSVAV